MNRAGSHDLRRLASLLFWNREMVGEVPAWVSWELQDRDLELIASGRIVRGWESWASGWYPTGQDTAQPP